MEDENLVRDENEIELEDVNAVNYGNEIELEKNVEVFGEVSDIYYYWFENEYVANHIMLNIQKMVNEIRKLTTYINFLTKCVDKLKSIQKYLSNKDKTMKVEMNVVTRWNYTLHMIQHIMQIHDLVNGLLSYYKSASGRREFNSNKKISRHFGWKMRYIEGY